MQPTPTELGLLRQRPHRTKLYLSIFQPTTVMACQVSGTVARNDYVIPYGSVTTGAYTDVSAGMTLLIGSTAGAEDIGRIRVRSVDANEFTVAENSDIDWQNGQHLTVLNYFEVWPVFPYIDNSIDPENPTWYKDYDILYTDQNTVLGAFPCAGPHRAAFVGDSIYYTASGTSHVADVGVAYDWEFEGGDVGSSTALTPGLVQYNTAGHYVTRLSVSGTNGSMDTTYRYVSIYDRPETGGSVPISRWSMGTLEGSRSGGGYNVSLTVHETVDVHEGDVVVIFGESWYGSTKGTIGGNAVGNSDIFFVGHILKGSIRYNYKLGEVVFNVGSVTQYMKEQEGFSISVESHPAPTDWYQLYDMDINKAMYHYLRWQSTVLNVTDFQSLVNDRPIQYFDSDRSSLYDAIDNLVRGSMLGGITADIQGKIWAEHGAQAFPSLSGQPYSSSIMTVRKQDWIGSPRIDEQLIPAASYIEYGGISFSGITTGTFAPLMANAPGNAPLYRGKQDRKQGLALVSQTELNGIVGNILANRNHSYPNIEYQIGGAYRIFDVAPQEKFTLQVDANDTPRGISINDSFLLDRISWVYNPQTQVFYPNSVGFVPLTSGLSGQTIVIPEIPPDDGVTQPISVIPPIPAIMFPSLLSNYVPSSKQRCLHRYISASGADIGSANTEYQEFSIVISSRDKSYLNGGLFTITTSSGNPVWQVSLSGVYEIEIFINIINGTSAPTDGWIDILPVRNLSGLLQVDSIAYPISGLSTGDMSCSFSVTTRLVASENIGIRVTNHTNGDIKVNNGQLMMSLRRQI